ncbi:class I SAM-dependent methyltransferase [Ruegeria sp. HKCCD8929]|uniref:class I SAM-dependent methyltransferase n=1 Tax=Ruegeria sp. HKCCD8929 TaxID=2683006 RepID=UPI0020C1E7D5|nr:class I SAM-dependent methyltransferase [Ruegeria sp. HKCCD8929]
MSVPNALRALTGTPQTLNTRKKETTMITAMQQTAPDYTAIKAKQNAAWASGDYARIGVTLQITGEELAEAANPAPGAKVLDVAGGNGNATLAFARRWCQVTSTDYVDTLLQAGRARAEAEGLDVTFEVADAEHLPYPDESFDMVVSTFGVMFTPNQKKSASEMMRVLRPGGRIAMANWTPNSFIGHLFKTLGRHVPPPAGVQSPALWGTDDWIAEQFADGSREIALKMKNFNFRYASTQHFVDIFKTFYGPVHKAFLALGDGAPALEADIVETVERFNIATDGTMLVPSEYAEIVITKA